jgi:hypothetical protein
MLSILIVNWNTRDLLRACLLSLCDTCRDVEHEIVVVDNASDDGSAALVRAQFPEVKLLANMENPGSPPEIIRRTCKPVAMQYGFLTPTQRCCTAHHRRCCASCTQTRVVALWRRCWSMHRPESRSARAALFLLRSALGRSSRVGAALPSLAPLRFLPHGMVELL